MPVMYSLMYIGERESYQDQIPSFLLLHDVLAVERKTYGLGKPHPFLYDLCLQHMEYVPFDNPHTGLKQQSHELRNVYYHARKACVTVKCPNPIVVIPHDIKAQQHIMHQFGLEVLNN